MREWIFRPAWSQAGGEESGQAVEAVGQTDDQADFVRGQAVAGEAWQVMIVDGLCHLGAFAGMQRVILAHDALQRGHFDDHVGDQVGLAQLGGAQGGFLFGVIQAEVLAEGGHHGFDAFGFIQHGAEFLLEGQRAQPAKFVLQLDGQVFIDEEGGVGEPRADDLFVAVGNHI